MRNIYQKNINSIIEKVLIFSIKYTSVLYISTKIIDTYKLLFKIFLGKWKYLIK
jgi:hypothetical protein